MRAYKPLQRLDCPATPLICIHSYRDPLPSRKLPVMIQGICAVDEVFQVAADIVIIGRGPDDENIAVKHFLYHIIPVIVLNYTPLLFLAFFTAQAWVDLLSRCLLYTSPSP